MTYYSELASFFVRIAVNLILVGTPISVGTLIVLRLTRAAAPRARYLLTLTAFFAAAVLPFVLTVAPPAKTRSHSAIVESSNTDSATFPGEPPRQEIQARQIEPLPQSERSATSVRFLDSLVRFLSRPSLSIGLFTLWLVGACLLLSREAGSHLRLARARRQWVPASANIRERMSWPKDIPLFVDKEFGPCALGVLNSVVVIPARLFDDLSLSAAQQIARHELDHLKWRDPLVHAAIRVVRAALWPSAHLWYLARATCLEREAASDRAAVSSTLGPLQPDIAALEYASTLISMAKRCADVGPHTHAWVATDVLNESGLHDRVRRLMAVSSRLTGTRLLLAITTLLISASFLIVLPVARFESKRNENSAQQRGQHKAAFTEPTRIETEPVKDQSNKAAGRVSINRRSPGDAQDEPESTPFPTPPEAVVEDDRSSTPIAPSAAPVNANPIQHVTELQLEILKNQMAALGYKDLTSMQLADMRASAVGPAYVAEMADSGYSGLSADMLIRFKWLGVNSSYIREMKTLGYDNLSPETLVTFRQHGVNANYIRQMRSRISGSISAEEIASLRFYGVSIEFVDQLKQMGYGNINAGQLISMRLQGVSIPFIENLHAQGRKGLSADDLIALRMRGSN